MSDIKAAEILSKYMMGEKATITFHYHSETILRSIEAVFAKILAKMDIVFLLDSLITVLREIITNAVKANAKRFYFQKLNLDINDPESYQKGIESFKTEIMAKFDKIEQELNESEYSAKFSIQKTNDNILVTIVNNSAIHPEELARINLRIEKAKGYKDFTDAYDEIYDDTEGAGLGIVLTILLLKNTGIGEDSYKIETDGTVTKSTVNIPLELQPRQITTKIKDQIINEINGLPTFHENILMLQKLCKNPDAEINEIADKIVLDPALTADILKLSNSAHFIKSKRVENLHEAIMTIGLKNLNDILTATGARSILEERYSIFAEIWAHCNKTAFYAKNIATKYNLSKSITDNAFLCGLLHDLGKIVLLATDKKFTSWISDLTKNRKIRTSTVLEEVSLGISHSAIGELMAKKWSFPDYLVESIKFHHSPLSAKDELKDLIFTVYLANMLCGFETKKYNYYFFEEEVLEKFKLTSPSEVEELQNKLKKQYDDQTA